MNGKQMNQFLIVLASLHRSRIYNNQLGASIHGNKLN